MVTDHASAAPTGERSAVVLSALEAPRGPSGGRGASILLEGLSKAYGAVVAVSDVTLTVCAGEFFTLLGPSGSGKSSTLQMIAGFAIPTRGRLAIDGREVADLPPQKRDLGMVFQNYALFPHLTVFENVAFPLRVRAVRDAELRRRVGEALAMVKLDGFERRLPRQLSGGQQQRVAVARALVFRPRALLMDEPLGALDKKLREQMQLELKQLQRTIGVTVVYVTHDQEEALTMSDRIAVMRDGMIEQVGTPEQLYDRPGTPFVAEFLGDANFLRGTVVGIEPDGSLVVETPWGGKFRGVPTKPIELGQNVLGALRPGRVTTCEAHEDGLAWGVVDEAVYVGDAMRIRVRTAKHGVLTIREQSRLGSTAPRVGDAARLGWRAEDVRIFRA